MFKPQLSLGPTQKSQRPPRGVTLINLDPNNLNRIATAASQRIFGEQESGERRAGRERDKYFPGKRLAAERSWSTISMNPRAFPTTPVGWDAPGRSKSGRRLTSRRRRYPPTTLTFDSALLPPSICTSDPIPRELIGPDSSRKRRVIMDEYPSRETMRA